jgi:crotonobetainyl-CoA:carnitine CoA-transferase CaiB-like acyl-CoA transferase
VVAELAPLVAYDVGQRVERATAIDAALAAWCRDLDAADAAAMLRHAGVPAAELASSTGLVASEHLRERGFWDQHGSGVLPALPWRASFGRATGPAPELGADTDTVLRELIVGR